ncbi:hypothetical protein [Nocardia higoensis]|uniref:hypothetical protein n=1 Tax=Nocardia higoensis TaxID=228599 RepID=UPI000306C531|nr:hypothetical protein [Nocardia higoensis]
MTDGIETRLSRWKQAEGHVIAGEPRRAVGGGPHDSNDPAVTRLEQHIEIGTPMRDAYAAAIGQLEATDRAAASRMDTRTEGVG